MMGLSSPLLLDGILMNFTYQDFPDFIHCGIQDGREISVITVTDDYLCYKEPKSPYNFFIILIFNELLTFKTSN